MAQITTPSAPAPASCANLKPPPPETDTVAAYIWTLPQLRCRVAHESAKLDATASTTYDMVMARRIQIDSLKPVLYKMASFYEGWGDSTAAIIDTALKARLHWVSFATQPQGFGLSGSITQVTGADGVIAAIAGMIEDLVVGLYGNYQDFDLDEWTRQWHAADSPP